MSLDISDCARKTICLDSPLWWNTFTRMATHKDTRMYISKCPLTHTCEKLIKSHSDMVNWTNASNHHRDVWIPPRGLCCTCWDFCYKRQLHFQHDCQTGPHGTAFLKELSSTATTGGLVGRERGRERESVGLSGLCKAYWSVNDVSVLPRLGHSMATDWDAQPSFYNPLRHKMPFHCQ